MGLLMDKTGDLEKLIVEAEQMVERRNPEAFELAEKAMALALESNNALHIASAQYILAFYYGLVANDYDQAIIVGNRALQKLDAAGLNEIGYKIYMTLGNSYQLRGEVFLAQENYMKGLKLLEKRPGLNEKEKRFLGSFYYNISVVLSTGELEIPADDYILKAIEIYKEINYNFQLSKSYSAYAGVLEKRNEYEAAIPYLFKALEMDEQMNEPYNMALTRANLGIIHLKINKFHEALAYLNYSLDYYKENGMVFETALVKLNLGETLFATDNKTNAIIELKEAEEMFTKLDNKRELSSVYKILGDIYGAVGNHEQSALYLRKYSESIKSILNIEKLNALTRAKKEFETEHKEREAALLKEKNEEISRYVKKLEISNNELQQFAHVASHDLREPLRMVKSYLTLLERSLEGKLSEEQLEFIEFALKGSSRMDQLIVDLLRLAKIDNNTQPDDIKLRNLVSEVKLNLHTLIKEKDAHIIVPEKMPVLVADRTQMLQLFQNIISNGIKYNNSQKPVIKIDINQTAEDIEISIADNGIGIPEHQHNKVFEIFQRLHSASEYNGSGIGLTICKKIVDGMNGKIWIENNRNGGTIFFVRFPVSVLKPDLPPDVSPHAAGE